MRLLWILRYKGSNTVMQVTKALEIQSQLQHCRHIILTFVTNGLIRRSARVPRANALKTLDLAGAWPALAQQEAICGFRR
jgi:hypothetical protein